MARKLSGPMASMVESPMAGVHRVAPADPVPEAEHVGRVDAELRHLLGVGGDGDEVLGRAPPASPLSAGQQPVARGVRVGHRSPSVVKVLEETMNSVSAGSRPCTASAKSVPSTLDTKRKVIARSL